MWDETVPFFLPGKRIHRIGLTGKLPEPAYENFNATRFAGAVGLTIHPPLLSMLLPAAGRHISGSICQCGTALRAAAGKHLAAVARFHSLAEAMFLKTLALFRLICAKHT